ncbi:NOP protein chaperone 1 - like 1 [Theobroma cacao]|uniref:Unconventional prefoldin RPB5 interactor 1 n=3 Tax=Theobroma cacao TaxID=3641 RepID=A0AB32VDQ8_THECC|nr:PREDICTED: unconventional prefoldin RPB5 interactor 1 [Theobroma cacao]EOX97250.1 Uncharacterized protein TCM_006330 isoform 1 [Theobroma cacao]WRX14042.1 NOP protein chaperone 1 - like 1 [Theobroma cacao]
MGSTSKDLLRFEHKTSSTSPLESALLVTNKKDSSAESRDPAKKPSITPVPKSQLLGKVKDFLGVMAEANKRLELDAKNNSQAYDIEVLNGNEPEVIEMDLMLGVADLHTPEAVAAAESAIAGNQPAITLAGSSSETESDDSSDDSNDDNEESKNDGNDDNETSRKLEKSNTGKDHTISEAARKHRSKKRSRIVELS